MPYYHSLLLPELGYSYVCIKIMINALCCWSATTVNDHNRILDWEMMPMEGSTHGRLPGLLYLLVTVSTPLVSDLPDVERLDREKWIPRTVD